jgi:hypothetical protein
VLEQSDVESVEGGGREEGQNPGVELRLCEMHDVHLREWGEGSILKEPDGLDSIGLCVEA